MKFSYSSLTTYEECPKKFDLHYNKRIRPKKIDSPLFFGNATDEAFSRLLLEKKKNLTDDEKLLMVKSWREVFDENMKVSRDQNLATNEWCDYSKKDFSPDLLTEEDYSKLKEFDGEIYDFLSFYQECRDVIEKGKKLSLQDQKTYNYMNWLSLYNKGLLLIDAYEKEVIPKISEVFDIQKTITLNNGEDEITGKIDFKCSFIDEPDKVYICDNKTSSKAYKEDSVSTSLQLAIYCESEEILDASYVVVEKEVRKREPKIRITIIKDKISEESFQKAFQRVDNLVKLIKSGEFSGKSDKKQCYSFGKKCPYYKYCWEGSMSGLETKP